MCASKIQKSNSRIGFGFFIVLNPEVLFSTGNLVGKKAFKNSINCSCLCLSFRNNHYAFKG